MCGYAPCLTSPCPFCAAPQWRSVDGQPPVPLPGLQGSSNRQLQTPPQGRLSTEAQPQPQPPSPSASPSVQQQQQPQQQQQQKLSPRQH
jgi:hypothetical protein